MDYKEKYEQALERVRIKYADNNYAFAHKVLEEIFPELAESEDERIRKNIITYLKQRRDRSSSIPAAIGSWIAWLEKQGEHANFRNKIQIGDKVTRNEDGVLINLSQLKRVAKPANKKQKDILEDVILDSNEDGLVAETIRCKKEKQGEQKPADKVEPKFKVGDWVVIKQ